MRTLLILTTTLAALASVHSSAAPRGYRLDPAFAPVLPALAGNIDVMAIQTDGKMLVGGDFQFVNGEQRLQLARLERDGSIDPSFHAGIGFTGGRGSLNLTPIHYLSGIHVQPDGRILITGYFLEVDNVHQQGIARLLSDGQLDLAFRPVVAWGDGGSASISKSFLRPDGKILIAGLFELVNGLRRAGLAQLNPDGSLDSIFAPAPRFEGELHSLEYIGLQPGGRLITRDGQLRLGRFNADGSRDSAFIPDFNARHGVLGITPDGFMIAPIVWNGMQRFDPDGKPDPTYGGPTDWSLVFPRFLYLDASRLLADGSLLASAALGEDADRPQPKEFGLLHLLPDGRVNQDSGVYFAVASNSVGVVTSKVAQVTALQMPRPTGPAVPAPANPHAHLEKSNNTL